MTRAGWVAVDVREDLLARLWEIAPRFGLAVLRPTDRRRRTSNPLVVERAIEHVLACLPRQAPTLQEAEARALVRELEEARP